MIKPPLTIEGRHPFFSSLPEEKLTSKWGDNTLTGLQMEALYYCSLSDTALVEPGIDLTEPLRTLRKLGMIKPKYSYWELTSKGKKWVEILVMSGMIPSEDFEPQL